MLNKATTPWLASSQTRMIITRPKTLTITPIASIYTHIILLTQAYEY